jgi:hypothetical protein
MIFFTAGVGVILAAASHPFINFRHFELPQPSNLVGWHFPVSDPTVNRVLADTQMLGDSLQGHPRLRLRHLTSPLLSVAELCRQLQTHAENASTR